MPPDRIGGYYCHYCHRRVWFVQHSPDISAHLVLSLFTCGLWLPVAMLILLLTPTRWQCEECGTFSGD